MWGVGIPDILVHRHFVYFCVAFRLGKGCRCCGRQTRISLIAATARQPVLADQQQQKQLSRDVHSFMWRGRQLLRYLHHTVGYLRRLLWG
jgi:hypothetical protein